MPMFEFKCGDCGEQFEELLFKSTDIAPCPKCESKNVSKLVSRFASTVKSGGSQAAPACPAKTGSGFG